MNVEFKINEEITVDEFLDLLQRSGLAERRPVHDRECIAGMIAHCSLLITARANDTLVGLARSLTDFHYACYLSELAVDKSFQSHGIGIELQRKTQAQLGRHCKIILIAAPKANSYYPKIGYTNNQNCWVISKDQTIG